MKSKLLISLFLFFFALSSHAQNDYIVYEELPWMTKEVALDGKSSMVILSSHDDLVILSSSKSLDEIKSPVKNEGGKYEYEILLDVSKQRDRRFVINRFGKVIETEIKNIFQPNKRVFYSIEEVEEPIMLNDQTGKGSGHFVEGEACIEFNTTIDDLQVDYSEHLNANLKKTQSAAGTHVLSLYIPVAKIAEIRNRFETIQEEYNQLDLQIREEKIVADDAIWAKLDNYELEMEKLISRLDDLSILVIHGEKTNKLSVDISDIGPKEKRSYSVLLLKEKDWVSDYAQFLENGKQSENNRKFSAAKGFYEQVLASEEAPGDLKDTMREKIAEMEQCADLTKKAENSMRYIMILKKEDDDAKIQEVEDQFRNAKICYENLYRLRGSDSFYKDLIDKIDVQLDKLNFYVIEGSVRAKNGGARINGVSIYAVSNTVFSKQIEKKAAGVKVGEVDDEGNFRLEVRRDAGYGGLLFVPEKNKEFDKNGFVPLQEKHLKTTIYIYD